MSAQGQGSQQDWSYMTLVNENGKSNSVLGWRHQEEVYAGLTILSGKFPPGEHQKTRRDRTPTSQWSTKPIPPANGPGNHKEGSTKPETNVKKSMDHDLLGIGSHFNTSA